MANVQFPTDLWGGFLPGGTLLPQTAVRAADRATAESWVAKKLGFSVLPADVRVHRFSMVALPDDGEE